MNSIVFNTSKKIILNSFDFFYGNKLNKHKIPFGVLAGRYIYTKPSVSLRMFLGFNEPELFRISKHILKPEDVVYDIGAHIGYTSIFFSQLVGQSGKVQSFELLPSTADILQKTIDLNCLDNCHIHRVGLSDSREIKKIAVGTTYMGSFGFSPGFESSGEYEDCLIDSLDNYRQVSRIPLPNFIKIDIEGSEVKALKGASKTILQANPLIIVEFHSLELLTKGFEFLTGIGYQIYFLSGEQISHEKLTQMKEFHESVFCYRPDCLWHRDRLSLLNF
jgi:FkbM family methyltransferase